MRSFHGNTLDATVMAWTGSGARSKTGERRRSDPSSVRLAAGPVRSHEAKLRALLPAVPGLAVFGHATQPSHDLREPLKQ